MTKDMVLILDDEPDIRQDLLRSLKRKGYEVCTAESIEVADQLIMDHNIDFAIIDLKIDYTSEYGGIDVIEYINKRQPHAKIIVISAYEFNIEIEEKLKNVKFDKYISKGGEDNYILAVIDALTELKKLRPKKKCFVIMPFSATTSCKQNEWLDIFENTIKPAIDDSGFNYECSRASLTMGNIINDIIDNLNRSEVVIADLTDRNPNVFYELGVRHSLRNVTILITQRMDDIPFDLQPYAVIKYDWKTKQGKESFKQDIAKVLSEIERDPNSDNTKSPVRHYLERYR